MKMKYFVKDENGVFGVDENYEKLSWPLIPECNQLLAEKLLSNGIEREIVFLGDSCYFEIFPTEKREIEITAPLYESKSGSLRLKERLYTATIVDPEQYAEVQRIYERCNNELFRKKRKEFIMEFKKLSTDGMTAIMDINTTNIATFKGFMEDYIPEEYTQVAVLVSDWFIKTVMFIKQFDAKRAIIDIHVPEKYAKGHVIGKGGNNIKSIANIINASQINVC